MRLGWFEVQGYKNFRAPVRLADLGRFNVLHGENNVGKSNLLEAIGLLFVALGALREEAAGRTSVAEAFARTSAPTAKDGARIAVRSGKYLAERGFPPEDIFDFTSQAPISLQASFLPDPGDVAPGEPPSASAPIEIALRIEPRPEGAVIALSRLVRPEGTDLSAATDDAVARVLHRLGPRTPATSVEPRFFLIRADRSVVCDPPQGDAAPLVAREPLPPDLGLALHRAELGKGAPRQRFDRFVAALEHIRSLVGEGRWRMNYDPEIERAELYLERGSELIPLRLMGSGVQQIAVLAGRLAMAGPAVVAIEEPELNLRWSAQHRLRDMLRELCGLVDGPSQLLVTSHSSAFEFEPTFYALTSGAGGPEVRRRPAEEAPRHLDPEVERPPEGSRAPLSYVTRDGLVRVPDDVRRALGVADGGGVTFVEGKDGLFYMLGDAQLLNMIEPGAPRS
jgi:predicted ATPase